MKLASEEVIQRNQMASIYGGSDNDFGFTMCDCTTDSGTKTATCSDDLVNQGGNKCCAASYGSSSEQSGC